MPMTTRPKESLTCETVIKHEADGTPYRCLKWQKPVFKPVEMFTRQELNAIRGEYDSLFIDVSKIPPQCFDDLGRFK